MPGGRPPWYMYVGLSFARHCGCMSCNLEPHSTTQNRTKQTMVLAISSNAWIQAREFPISMRSLAALNTPPDSQLRALIRSHRKKQPSGEIAESIGLNIDR
jgi:hypothetical protein